MKAVIYARVSSRRQAEAGTIETQLDAIYKDHMVAVRFGPPREMEQYLDNGVSGRLRPLWERPNGKQLLADAKDGKFDVVIVYKFSRIGRKAADTEIAIDELLSYGVSIYDVKNQLLMDNTSAAGKMVRQMMGIAAEFEVNNDIETMRDGLIRLASAGKPLPSSLHVGYDWTQVDEWGRKAKGAILVINQEEAELVKLIFDLYEEIPLAAVTKRLNDIGKRLPCKTPRLQEKYGRTERLFVYRDILKIISDSLYTGMWEWGRTTKMPGQTPIPYRHHFPELQIISFEQFNRVQRLKEQRRQVPNKSQGSAYIYSSLLKCPKCSGATVAGRRWQKQYGNRELKVYQCRAYHTSGKAACDGWSLYEHTVNKAVVPFLADLLENKLGLRQYVEAEARQMVWEGHEGKAQRLQAEKETAQGQLKNVQRMTVEGLMTSEEAKPFIYQARETIERAEKQLVALRQRVELHQGLLEAISQVCNDVKGTLERLEPMALQAVVRQVFKNITITKQGRGHKELVEISAYQFHEEIKDLLAQSSTLNIDTPSSGSCRSGSPAGRRPPFMAASMIKVGIAALHNCFGWEIQRDA